MQNKPIDKPDHFENYCFKCIYLPEKKRLDEVFLEFGTDEDLLAGKRKTVEMLKRFKVKSFLSDTTTFKGASPEASKYVHDVWCKEITDAGMVNLAIVVSPDVFANFSVEVAFNKEYLGKINAEMFKTYEEADKWLNKFN